MGPSRFSGNGEFRRGSLLLGLDFDGTLAPIAAKPKLACLPQRNRRLLEALVGRNNVVVVIVSGRSLADVKTKVNVPGVYHAGNHGLEIEGPDGKWIHPQAKEVQRMVRTLARDVSATLGRFPGLLLEDKGLTLSLHYRLLPKNLPSAPLLDVLRRLIKPYAYRLHITHGHKVW